MDTTQDTHTLYRPTKRSLDHAQYGPTFATREEAEAWIETYERSHGLTLGCDHGFGVGSGFQVEEVV